MKIVYTRCCGLDVHKSTITACVLTINKKGQPETRKQVFGTFYKELLRLKQWLRACRVTHVAMESTGVYWKPVWHVLEGCFNLTLTNPQQMKAIPGRKTDQKDSEWIAELLAHGLLRKSFVPPPEIRQLRDLTRYRVQYVCEYNRVHNRIHKVLEDAGIKLSSVVSDLMGVSGRRIVRAIIAREENPAWLAYKAKGTLRTKQKQEQLRQVLRGHVTDHHRYLLEELMEDLEHVENKIARLEQAIANHLAAHQDLVERLCTIPGVDRITAWTILAELGMDMTVFPSAGQAANWAGMCPGNNVSAGKRKSRRTRKGNVWLRRGLCQSAWAVTRKKDCFLTALFYRKARQHGMKKAIVATAHRILIIAYCLLRRGGTYVEKGGSLFDLRNPERTKKRLLKRLEKIDAVLESRLAGVANRQPSAAQ
jgi:transposase